MVGTSVDNTVISQRFSGPPGHSSSGVPGMRLRKIPENGRAGRLMSPDRTTHSVTSSVSWVQMTYRPSPTGNVCPVQASADPTSVVYPRTSHADLLRTDAKIDELSVKSARHASGIAY